MGSEAQLPLCGMSSNETRSIMVAPGQGVTDAPIMAAGVDCNAKILTNLFTLPSWNKKLTLKFHVFVHLFSLNYSLNSIHYFLISFLKSRLICFTMQYRSVELKMSFFILSSFVYSQILGIISFDARRFVLNVNSSIGF